MSSEEAVHDQLTADLYMRSLHEDRQPLTTPQSGGLAVSVYREVHCAACFSNSIALQTIGDLFCRSRDDREGVAQRELPPLRQRLAAPRQPHTAQKTQ